MTAGVGATGSFISRRRVARGPGDGDRPHLRRTHRRGAASVIARTWFTYAALAITVLFLFVDGVWLTAPWLQGDLTLCLVLQKLVLFGSVGTIVSSYASTMRGPALEVARDRVHAGISAAVAAASIVGGLTASGSS